MTELFSEDDEKLLLVATFLIGDSYFGFDAIKVQEVIQIRKITPVHRSRHYIKGVMNLRGHVVTMIDLGEKLCLGGIVQNENNRIIIVNWAQEFVGFLVDSMADVVQIDRGTISDPPENIHGVQADLISGVFQNTFGRFIGLLDVDEVLRTEEKT
jgi:purine-binding chemotaxis protein CheW